ncbi:RDD family protein [Kiloniella sp.]|uniref:RDD family protein n=1 Tax=Kiloniella sp. TaxID=1938587 RepID=UPI003B026D76
MQSWYYWSNNTEFGPVSKLQLFTLFKEKQIAGYNFVRPEGSDEWTSYKELGIHQDDFSQQDFDNYSAFTPTGNTVPPIYSTPTSADNTIKPYDYPLEVDHDWKDASPHPWRRSFARFLDISIYLKFIYLPGINFLTSGMASAQVNQFSPLELMVILLITYVIYIPFAILLNASLIGLAGNTIGRWCFGIKTLEKDLSSIQFKSALKREFFVWKNGLAFGIPIINLITQVYGYLDLTMRKRTSWDKNLEMITVQREDNTKQFILCIIGIFCYWIITRFY